MLNIQALLKELIEYIRNTNQTYKRLLPQGLTTYPIPFFGNPGQANIVTISVNPSSDEFGAGRSWPTQMTPFQLEARLLNYFNLNNPQIGPHPFFDRWEDCLKVLGCSYYNGSAAHIDLSPRPTKAMATLPDADFLNMIKNDIIWFVRFLPFFKSARLLLTGGAVTRKQWFYETMVNYLPQHDHSIAVNGDLRRDTGSGWVKNLELKMPQQTLPMFFCSTGPSARKNRHLLKQGIEKHKESLKIFLVDGEGDLDRP